MVGTGWEKERWPDIEGSEGLVETFSIDDQLLS